MTQSLSVKASDHNLQKARADTPITGAVGSALAPWCTGMISPPWGWDRPQGTSERCAGLQGAGGTSPEG
jgi:hypothetical protein